MTKFSNNKIEAIAVNSIKVEGTRPNSFLRIDIPVGDKAPSFDGSITLFKDGSEKAESYLNEVPVQVKGTQVQNFSRKTKTFKLSMTHYKNFYKRGGCLLLVVEILDHLTTRIFYKHLLAIDLHEIIRNYGHQGSYSIQLRNLQETTLYNVCKVFSDQMTRQPQILIESNRLKESDFSAIRLTSPTFYPETFKFSEIFEHNFYLYGIIDDIDIPLRTVKFNSISLPRIESVEIIDGKIDSLVEITINKSERIIIKIENTVEIKINPKNNKINFDVITINSISSQIKVLNILKKIFKTGVIQFKGFYGEISKKEFEQELTKIDKELEFWLNAANIFSDLDIDPETNFLSSESIYNDLEHLSKMLSFKNYNGISVKNPEKPSFFRYHVGGLYIVLFYIPTSEIKFINPFLESFIENNSIASIIDSSEMIVKLSPFLLLEEETLRNAINLNFPLIISSYQFIDKDRSHLIFDLINTFCLSCLRVFDETKNMQLLDLVHSLILFLEENEKNLQFRDVLFINKMQTLLRKNDSFTENEKMVLLKLKIERTESNKSNVEILFCLNTLLNNTQEAAYYFDLFNDEQKNNYKNLPIFYIFKNFFTSNS